MTMPYLKPMIHDRIIQVTLIVFVVCFSIMAYKGIKKRNAQEDACASLELTVAYVYNNKDYVVCSGKEIREYSVK